MVGSGSGQLLNPDLQQSEILFHVPDPALYLIRLAIEVKTWICYVGSGIHIRIVSGYVPYEESYPGSAQLCLESLARGKNLDLLCRIRHSFRVGSENGPFEESSLGSAQLCLESLARGEDAISATNLSRVNLLMRKNWRTHRQGRICPLPPSQQFSYNRRRMSNFLLFTINFLFF